MCSFVACNESHLRARGFVVITKECSRPVPHICGLAGAPLRVFLTSRAACSVTGSSFYVVYFFRL